MDTNKTTISKQPTETSASFRRIGKGHCGSVWAVDRPGKSCALKREDGHPGRDIQNDYDMHRETLESLSHLQKTNFDFKRIHIPELHAFIPRNDKIWWGKRLHRFPTEYKPCNVLISERIQPILQQAQETLINHYIPEKHHVEVKVSRSNQDCLVRPYLGRRRHRIERARSFFSMQNFPLHLDQMEELGMDQIKKQDDSSEITTIARTMADTLAMMHWETKIDGKDVEFVLAAPQGSHSKRGFLVRSETLGESAIWLLDFDCCREMTMDEVGVQQAIHAFMRNDPFYPRPGGTEKRDQELWQDFRKRFLATSGEILGSDSPYRNLPEMVMAGIESQVELGRRKQYQKQQE